MGLDQYRRKRDFTRTPEPAGEKERSASGRLYVIQKHAARALHYDLRLELQGVLKSWAVPKGPSLDPGQKRLARHVEDHPIAYGGFEGIIPAGEYGAGAVLLWDSGEWEPEGDPEKGYRRGRLSFRLRGEKLHGAWTLARMGGRAAADGDNWLLIKRSDAAARPGDDGEFLEEHPRSVRSGRTLEEIAAARDLVWQDGRAVPGPGTSVQAFDPEALPGARRAEQPSFLSPQLARLVAAAPAGEEWLHEIKLDGYRLVCVLKDGNARLWTRNGLDWTERFQPVAVAASALPVRQAIFDGEVVVLDEQGKSDFQALQNLLREGGRGRLVYYLFDLLHCQGYDLTRVPLGDRKTFLQQLLTLVDVERSVLRYSDHIRGDGETVFRHACRLGLEGIVSKRLDTLYVPRRSGSWLKVKCQKRQEFVIGGFSEPGGSRSGFGALLVGYHDDGGRLLFGGKVGTGFDEATLQSLEKLLRERETPAPPFADPPRGREARGVHWVRPELVAEVEFTEWTQEGRLRHPSFKGLREDRPAARVGREREEEPASAMRDEQPVTNESPGRQGGAGPTQVAGVVISNPERIVYPEQGVSKLQLVEYYAAVGDRILPFVAGRPLTLVRCPQGRQKKCFYQKHLNESVPAPVRGVPVQEKEGEGLYLVIDDLPGLITLVQLGALEFHPWGSREKKLEYPDILTLDLDPDPEVAWEDVVHCARRLRERLTALGLRSFVKTSGGKGLHILLPMTPRSDWETAKEFTRALAEDIARREPGRYVTTMTKARRKGKIFIDFFRNSRGSTSVAPYSTRAKHGAPVSTPLAWEELSADVGPTEFTIENVPSRLAALRQDPWEGFFAVRQSITKPIRRELGF